jgi:hypothetical protein
MPAVVFSSGKVNGQVPHTEPRIDACDFHDFSVARSIFAEASGKTRCE